MPCRMTYQEEQQVRKQSINELLIRHHWVYRWKHEGRCVTCGKSFQQRIFRDKVGHSFVSYIILIIAFTTEQKSFNTCKQKVGKYLFVATFIFGQRWERERERQREKGVGIVVCEQGPFAWSTQTCFRSIISLISNQQCVGPHSVCEGGSSKYPSLARSRISLVSPLVPDNIIYPRSPKS